MHLELRFEIFFKKRFRKACGIRKRMLHLHPAKRGKFIERLAGFRSGKGKEIFLKKNFKKHLPVRNKFSTFAPALRYKRKKKKYTFVDILN